MNIAPNATVEFDLSGKKTQNYCPFLQIKPSPPSFRKHESVCSNKKVFFKGVSYSITDENTFIVPSNDRGVNQKVHVYLEDIGLFTEQVNFVDYKHSYSVKSGEKLLPNTIHIQYLTLLKMNVANVFQNKPS